jgi:hypothetical protein
MHCQGSATISGAGGVVVEFYTVKLPTGEKIVRPCVLTRWHRDNFRVSDNVPIRGGALALHILKLYIEGNSLYILTADDSIGKPFSF